MKSHAMKKVISMARWRPLLSQLPVVGTTLKYTHVPLSAP